VQTSKFYQIFARKIEFYPQKRLIRQFLRQRWCYLFWTRWKCSKKRSISWDYNLSLR